MSATILPHGCQSDLLNASWCLLMKSEVSHGWRVFARAAGPRILAFTGDTSPKCEPLIAPSHRIVRLGCAYRDDGDDRAPLTAPIGGRMMGEVAIACPHTGQTVKTGWHMPRRILKQSAVFDAVLDPCPACGGQHRWTREDAWVLEPWTTSPHVTSGGAEGRSWLPALAVVATRLLGRCRDAAPPRSPTPIPLGAPVISAGQEAEPAGQLDSAAVTTDPE